MITMMTTKDDDKGDEQKAQRSKNNSNINQRTTQVTTICGKGSGFNPT